jgi:hypothetical protein
VIAGPRTTRRLLIAALAGLLLLAGCGDGDDDTAPPIEDSDDGDDGDGGGSDDPLVQAMTTWLSTSEDVPPFDEDEAECVAQGVVDGVGSDRLEELGVTEEAMASEEGVELTDVEFTDDEVAVVIDSMEGCADLKALLAESIADDGTISAEDAECLVDELPEDFIRQGFEAEFAGDDITESQDLQNTMFDAIANCDIALDPSE